MRSNVLIGRSLEVIDKLDKEGRNTPLLIMSSPGLGKTTTIRMWCEYKGYNLTTLIASQYSQDDILGIQAVNNGKLERLTPAWFNDMVERSKNGRRNVLFIDEITTCDEFLQAPLLNLIFSSSLGLHTLPENTLIITAGNYSEELNGVFSMTPPLVNRFMILNLRLTDLSMREVTDDTIHREDTDIGEILGLKPIEGEESLPVFDENSLVPFIVKYIPFNESKIINNSKKGLIGFTSVRSVYNSINFYNTWVSLFSTSEYWARIVGDTLGTTLRGEGTVLVRDFLEKNIQFFVRKKRPKKEENSIDGLFDRYIQDLVIGTSEDLDDTYKKACTLIEHDGLSEMESKVLERVASVNGYTRNLMEFFKKFTQDEVCT